MNLRESFNNVRDEIIRIVHAIDASNYDSKKIGMTNYRADDTHVAKIGIDRHVMLELETDNWYYRNNITMNENYDNTILYIHVENSYLTEGLQGIDIPMDFLDMTDEEIIECCNEEMLLIDAILNKQEKFVAKHNKQYAQNILTHYTEEYPKEAMKIFKKLLGEKK